MPTDFGKFLHDVRKRTKGTQVAKSAGISYVYLLDLEKGARPVPSNTVLMNLANSLPFEKGERELFFDLAASESGVIPLDVSNFLYENQELIKVIRKIKDADVSKNTLCALLDSMRHERGE